MTKITLTNLSSISGNEQSAINLINANNAVIATASDNTLSRDGTSPNQMLSSLDMNSFRILNCVDAINLSEPATYKQVLNILGAITSVGAPNNASYLTLAVNSALTNERVLTAGAGITLTDGGAKGALTISSTGTITPAALTKTDDANVTLTLGGSPATSLVNAASITVGWTGTLAPSRGGTGIGSLGAGVATWLGTPSSANLAAAITDETGTGVLVFGTTPTFTTNITTPLIIGGTAVSSSLTLESTSGVGSSDSIIFKTGSQATRWTINTAGTLAGVNTAIGTLDIQNTSFTQVDGASWSTSFTRVGSNLNAVSGNQVILNIQGNITANSGATSYERVGLLIQMKTADPSNGSDFRDCSPIDTRGAITGGILTGRTWGSYCQAEIVSGTSSDGLLYGHEIQILNNGTDQGAIGTTTSKYGIHLYATGSFDSTAAIWLNGSKAWHKGVYADPSIISTGGTFLELLGKFSVDKLGKITVANSTATSGAGGLDISITQTQPNTTDTNDGSIRALWELTTASASNELVARVFKFQASNKLTGGGIISNLRIVNLTANYIASTTTTNSYGIYMEAGTVTGTVTTSYGLYFENNWTQGTTKWAIYDAAQLSSYLGGLSLGTLTQASAGNLLANGSILSIGATSGLGYSTGAGGTVTQGTSRTTGVTLNKVCGEIILFSQVNSAVSGATAQTFTVTNSTVVATDTILVHQKTGTDKYLVFVTNVAAGSFAITNYTTGGTTNEAPKFAFSVIKSAIS